MLQEPGHIALMTDIWTSVAAQSYVHNSYCAFISSNWELKTCLLQTTNFPENHTADSICEKLREKLSNFHLRLHDQGSNMQAYA